MLTVAVLAYNEEKNLRDAVESVIRAVETVRPGLALDVIIVNDGSTDGTRAVIQELESRYSFVRSVHHEANQGMGAGMMAAIQMAKFDSLMPMPGDNGSAPAIVRNLLKNVGKADWICCYPLNTEVRTRFRWIVSQIYGLLYMGVFDVRMIYFHAQCVYPVKTLRAMSIKARRYSFFAELHVKLMRSPLTFLEVEGYFNSDAGTRKSSALRLKNVIDVIAHFLRICWEVKISQRERYRGHARRVIPES